MAAFAKLDCTANQAVCEKYHVGGYPTLIYFGEDAIIEYDGEREIASFAHFLRRVSGPAMTIVESAEQYSQFVQNAGPVFYIFYGDEAGQDRDAVEAVAKPYQTSLSFALVKDPSFAGALFGTKAPSKPALVAVTPDREFFFPEGESFTKESIAKFVIDTRFGLVAELGPSTFNDMRKAQKPIVIFAVKASEADQLQRAQTLSKAVSPKFLEKFTFSWLDGEKWANYLLQSYDIATDKLPIVIIFDEKNRQFFQSQEATRGEDTFATFLDSVFSGAEKGKSLDRSNPVAQVNDLRQKLEAFVKANPLPSLGGVLLLGFVLGRLSKRGTSSAASKPINRVVTRTEDSQSSKASDASQEASDVTKKTEMDSSSSSKQRKSARKDE